MTTLSLPEVLRDSPACSSLFLQGQGGVGGLPPPTQAERYPPPLPSHAFSFSPRDTRAYPCFPRSYPTDLVCPALLAQVWPPLLAPLNSAYGTHRCHNTMGYHNSVGCHCVSSFPQAGRTCPSMSLTGSVWHGAGEEQVFGKEGRGRQGRG